MNQTKADSVNFNLRICTVFYLWFGNLFDHHDELKHHRGESKILERGFICIKVWGFTLLILSPFLKYPTKMK